MSEGNENGTEGASQPQDGKDARARRLAAELRANLARRKAQARSRRSGRAEARPEETAPQRKKTDP